MENIATITRELAPMKSKISQALEAANGLEIKTTEDMPNAVDLLSKIKMVGKAITQKKEQITKPLNESLKAARQLFAPFEQEYETAERIVKMKMVSFQEAQRLIAAKEAAKVEAKVEAGKMTMEKGAEKIESVTPQKTVATAAGTVQFRTVKEVVIEDESKIPDEYWVIDLVKLKKVVLAGVEVAGTKIVVKQQVAGITG